MQFREKAVQGLEAGEFVGGGVGGGGGVCFEVDTKLNGEHQVVK